MKEEKEIPKEGEKKILGGRTGGKVWEGEGKEGFEGRKVGKMRMQERREGRKQERRKEIWYGRNGREEGREVKKSLRNSKDRNGGRHRLKDAKKGGSEGKEGGLG